MRSRIVKEHVVESASLYRRSHESIAEYTQHGSGYARRTRSTSDRQRHSDASQKQKARRSFDASGLFGNERGLHGHLRNSRMQGDGLIALTLVGAIRTARVLHRMAIQE